MGAQLMTRGVRRFLITVNQEAGMAMSRIARQWLLFLYAAFLGFNVGGGLLASAVIFPTWAASREAAIGWERVVDEAGYFVVISPVVLLLAIASLAAAFRAGPELRRSSTASAALYVLFLAATLAYFVPGQAALQGPAAAAIPPAEHAELMDRWLQLNWIRQGTGVLSFVLALHALGLSYRVGAGPEGAHGSTRNAAPNKSVHGGTKGAG
jgi:hypothetical protein